MTKTHKLGIVLLIIIILSIMTKSTSANWYAGSECSGVYGVGAFISAPSGLNIVETELSGESNWVSTYYTDQNGTDWLQTGWKYYHWYSVPIQYVEWCIDCTDQGGTYAMHDTFANHTWGTTTDYKVQHIVSQQWCAYTGGYLRFCVNNLNGFAINAMAKSEVHVTVRNPLNTYFDQVRFLDPADNTWKLFDGQLIWHKDFPYNIEIFSNSHFHSYRVDTQEVYLPIIVK